MADTKYVGLTTSEIIRMGVLLAAMAAMAAGYAGLRTETTRLVEDIAGHTVLECHPSACVALGRTDERLIQLDKRMIEQASTAAAARSNLSAAASGANTDITSLTANAMTPSGGTLNVTGNVTAYSAAAAKDDIVQIPNALELVQRMRGVSFRWKHEDRGYEKSREALDAMFAEHGQYGQWRGDADPATYKYRGHPYRKFSEILGLPDNVRWD